MMLRHSELSGTGDRSGRSRIALPAVAAPRAISWPPLPMLAMLAGVAAVTPGSPMIALGSSGTPAVASTRTSEPTANAAWSAADRCQLAPPSQRERGGGRRDDDEQDRSRLADRPPADLPAHHGGGQPPAALGCPVGQPGQQRQRTERHERDSGQRERGSDGDHGIDPE